MLAIILLISLVTGIIVVGTLLAPDNSCPKCGVGIVNRKEICPSCGHALPKKPEPKTGELTTSSIGAREIVAGVLFVGFWLWFFFVLL